MIDFYGVRIGFVMTGSFCTFSKAFEQAKILKGMGADLIPIMSYNAYNTSTRFGTALQNIETLENICEHSVISSIDEAEPLGPQNMTDIIAVAPCTGNTIAKLALSITDTAVVLKWKQNLYI